MDAEESVSNTVTELRKYMALYVAEKSKWVAPYTSIVTSSMMGKSRHMKEVANHLPTVYICLRREGTSYGYPHRSPSIVDWLSAGAATIVAQPVFEYFSCFSTYRWSAFILCTIQKLTAWIKDDRFFTSLNISEQTDEAFQFQWLWKFFAEPSDESKLTAFWDEVKEATRSMLLHRKSGLAAHAYFQKQHTADVLDALTKLSQCFGKSQNIGESLPLILIYDEARTLCEREAYNGAIIYDERTINIDEPDTPFPHSQDIANPFRSFSNFFASRRALRYFSATTGEIPGIFAVFTDTTSRITNFQPTSWSDPSMRVPDLPAPGKNQFPPLFIFSSVDVFSRVLNNITCLSNPAEVADPDRLLKFGRAGWYSTYFYGKTAHNGDKFESNSDETTAVLNLATSKLICEPYILRANNPFNATFPLSRSNLIKLLAILGPRLALTIGPYTAESSELIASHLAVLTRTDNERHFLRTVYPSEPVVAEVSARLTHAYGWTHPLSALVHYVKGGIVCAGFRGELITKIVCLMAMDDALSSIPKPPNQWTFSRPILVSEFLNHLIVPLHNYATFSEGLKGVRDPNNITHGTLNVDDRKLQQFLSGYVFFNHFIRAEIKLSYPMLVHAWNRGAAMMCMTNTKGIDFVIPVMLDSENKADFGPLHGRWEEEHIQQARKRLSFIIINSKLYSTGRDQTKAAWAAKFSAKNIRDYEATEQDIFNDISDDESGTVSKDLDSDSQYIWEEEDNSEETTGLDEMMDVDTENLEMDNVFMSLIQDFGKKRRNEEWVYVGGMLRTYTHPRQAQPPLKRPPLKTQFVVVLKEIGADTYECLKDEPSELRTTVARSRHLREKTRSYLKELMSSKVDYVDQKDRKMAAIAMQNMPLVYGESMLWSDKWIRRRPSLEDGWHAEHESSNRPVESQSGPMTASDIADERMSEVEDTST